MLDRASPDVVTAKALFGEIKEASFRANEVFASFLRLFGGGNQDRQAVDVNALTLEAIRLLRKDLDDHSVTASTKLAADLPTVAGNIGQLREVILNLIQNSIDALASSTGGPRVISIETTHIGAGAISISLQDTGPGIDTQRLVEIFDPFVTTKATGTGLGLAICKMIVDHHGGKLSAESSENAGARFMITLPSGMASPAARANA
jgi:signal transduction histidine kinase